MVRRAVIAVLAVFLCAAGPAPQSSGAAPSVGHSTIPPLARLRALATHQRLAQVQCPPPDDNESFCGVYNNECIYCPSGRPHICFATGTCYQYASDAQAACGNDWSVCGRPAG